MKFKLLFSSRVFHACACRGMIAAAPLQAAVVTVFLDNGVNAPGSTNTAIPFVTGDRVATWDVTAAQQGGLTSLGAPVMEVRMVTLNLNGGSRAANTGGGNGLGVDTGGNVAWMDGSTREAGLFQLTFFSDVGKTIEITGLDITLSSVIVRMNNVSTMLLDARAGSGALTFDDGAAIPATIGAPADNNSNVYLGGAPMSAANDGTNADTSDLGLVPTTSAGINYYTMASTGVTFAEDDSLWLRRRNSAGVDTAYQLGAFTLNIVPEPSSAMLVLGGLLALGLHRRR